MFSGAVTRNRHWRNNRIRPKVNETLANEEDVEPSDKEEEESEEARKIARQKTIYKPTREEWDEHMRTHIPFRRWCPFCVKGKCKNNPHGQRVKSSEQVISFDYMGPKSKDDKSDKIDSLPIIVGSDRKHKWKIAHMVPKKGHDPHAIKMVVDPVSALPEPDLPIICLG